MKRAEAVLKNKHPSPSVQAAPSPYSKHQKRKGNGTRLAARVDCLWIVPSLDKCLLWGVLPKPRAAAPDFPFWQGTGRGRSHPAGLSKQDFMQEAQAGQKPARAASSSVTSQTVSRSHLTSPGCSGGFATGRWSSTNQPRQSEPCPHRALQTPKPSWLPRCQLLGTPLLPVAESSALRAFWAPLRRTIPGAGGGYLPFRRRL